MTTRASEELRADVTLRLPADGAFVSVLRSTAAGLASRLAFDLDQIEDLRVAVGEACALALPGADTGSELAVQFELGPSALTVGVTVTGAGVEPPDHDGFAWQVLDTMAPGARAEVHSDRLTIVLTVGSQPTSA